MYKTDLCHFIIVCSIVIFSTGCSLAPKYERPPMPVADSWPKGNAYKNLAIEADGPSAMEVAWQNFFINEKLKSVIAMALTNNRDLRVAALNIDKMRALYRIQGSQHFPAVNGSASSSAQRLPDSLSPTGKARINRQYQLSVGVSAYELDFFGKIRSLKKRALEQFLATEQARSSVQLSLIAEIARTWLTIAADQERLKLANDTFHAQQATYTMIKHRYEVGASSELDLRQAQTRVDAAQLDIVRYTGKVAQDKNALTFLVGADIDASLFPETLSIVDNANQTLRQFSPGMPSRLLLNRPDVQAAEMQLKAANANIGAARAAFFPQITLTGSVGTAGDELDTLFKGGTTWSFIPQITIPIFTAGRNSANLKAVKIDREIAIAEYEKTIQAAFREVSDTLAQSGIVNDQLDAQQSLLDATAESYRLSEIRYKKGIDSYLTVLDAQRSLYSTQQAMIDTRLLKLINRVTLYKVLGGGWEPAS